jgi:hypothetical protein
MPWYAAHIVMAFNVKDGEQRSVPVWENIVLINADNPAKAKIKAIAYGERDAAIEDDSLTLDGVPAKMIFVGVRKIIDCVNSDSRPDDGIEVSYLEMEFSDMRSLSQFMEGKSLPSSLD